MNESRNSSFSSLISAITLDEDYGYSYSNCSSSGVSANSIFLCSNSGIAIPDDALDGCLHTNEYYGDESDSCIKIATTNTWNMSSPRPMNQQRTYGIMNHHDTGRFLHGSATGLPFSLLSPLPKQRVSRFDMVCLNPHSSSAELRAPLHPNSYCILGSDDISDRRSTGHFDHKADSPLPGQQCRFATLAPGSFKGSLLPLSKPVRQRSQDGGGIASGKTGTEGSAKTWSAALSA